MVVRFPYRGPPSFLVGGLRVEPLLAGHRTARGYADASVMVVLDGDELHYVQPITRN